MSTFQVSEALLNSSLMRRKPDDALLQAVEAGDTVAMENWVKVNRPGLLGTQPAGKASWFKSMTSGRYGQYGETARQRHVYNRAKSRGRKRTMGGAGVLPHSIRADYTEGERSVLTVIALECKRRGFCDWPIDKIAAMAGVCRRTVQYALATATGLARRHLSVDRRPVKGRRNLTNIIKIKAAAWLTWLKRGPSLDTINEGIGCKEVHGTKKREFLNDSQNRPTSRNWLLNGRNRQDRASPHAHSPDDRDWRAVI